MVAIVKGFDAIDEHFGMTTTQAQQRNVLVRATCRYVLPYFVTIISTN